MRIFAIAICFVLLAPGGGEAADSAKSVRDWTAACSYSVCTAETAGEDGLAMGGQGYRLMITRSSGSSTGWRVSLNAHKVPKPGDDAALTFAVPGVDLPAVGISALSDGDSFGLEAGAALEQVLPALRKGKQVTVGFSAAEGPQNVEFSLSGLAAVLLWIDERQDRVGNSDQVAGAEDAAGTATITELTVLPPALYELLKITPDCSPLDNEHMVELGVARHRLDAETELYSVPCWTAAYNTIERYFTVATADGAVTPLLFATFADFGGWQGTAEMINSAYDPATRQLSTFVKARGLADCGGAGLWLWEDHMFKLTEYRYQGECGGAASSDARKWPMVYSTSKDQ